MLNYIKLVRAKYIIFVFAMQYLVYQNILKAILQKYKFAFQPDEPLMYLVFAATALIMAGGFVLNDYFDVKIDTINRRDKVIVSQSVSRRQAMLFYQILTASGMICGLLFAMMVQNFTLAFIFMVVPGILWFYSASYKRMLILGNAAAAFAAALAILAVTMGYLAVLENEVGNLLFQTHIPHDFYTFTGGFVLFIFLSTWILNILKDFRNEYGDREMESRTMVIKWGIKTSKIFTIVLIIIQAAMLLVFNRFLSIDTDYITLKYFAALIIVPLAVLIYLIFKATCSTEYTQAEFLMKMTVIAGILYSFVLAYLLAKAYGFPLYGKFLIK